MNVRINVCMNIWAHFFRRSNLEKTKLARTKDKHVLFDKIHECLRITEPTHIAQATHLENSVVVERVEKKMYVNKARLLVSKNSKQELSESRSRQPHELFYSKLLWTETWFHKIGSQTEQHLYDLAKVIVFVYSYFYRVQFLTKWAQIIETS